MNFYSPLEQPFDDLLERICRKLQLTKTQHEIAEQRYLTISDWLSRDDSPFVDSAPKIYPQGSLKIGTTVHPLHQQEYDLDLVCELSIDWRKYPSNFILDTFENYLKENELYRQKTVRKNRCIRIRYANEFHLDILPAAPDLQKNNGSVKVPDDESQGWKASNPKGYAEWFEDVSRRFRYEFAFKAEVDPLPEHQPVERKTPLQRVVQLLKRHRDLAFKQNVGSAPISIVLTTLAGLRYEGEVSVASAVDQTLSFIVDIIPPNEQRLVVKNPQNTEEDLSERWDNDPILYQQFVEWVRNFQQSWMELRRTTGISKIAQTLGAMFGEDVTNSALKEQAEFHEKLRAKNQLGVSPLSGLLVKTSNNNVVPIRPNTFYGK